MVPSNRLARTITVAAVIASAAAWCGAKSIAVPSAGIKTISQAVARAAMGDTVWVDRGVYREKILLAPGMAIMARESFKAVIDGGGRGTVVTLGKNNTVSGFEIRNGTIGVFSNGEGNVVRNCRIVNNWQTGIITVRHLPTIEDNIIAFNRGSGIQGWDVRSTVATVNHNTIAFNGNHGIAVGGSSNIVVENNVIAWNERFAFKILNEAEGVRITNNNVYANLRQPGGVPKGNFTFDPAFISPRMNLNFSSDPRLCCQIKGTYNENLGARLTY
jgi:parallel beta-helix repeat protein